MLTNILFSKPVGSPALGDSGIQFINMQRSQDVEKGQKNRPSVLEKVKAQYDSAAADLRKLLEERESRRQKLLMAAIAKSDKSFEDILRFLESKPSDHDK